MHWFHRTRKTIVALVGGIVVVIQLVQAALVDEAISLDEARGIILAVTTAITAAGVYWVPNKEPET